MLITSCLVACATTRASAPVVAPPVPSPPVEPLPTDDHPPPREVILEPVMIEVVTSPSGEVTSIVTDARTLLDRGNAALAEGRTEDALTAYGQLLRDFPDSRLVVAALYNAGLAFETRGDLTSALARYRDMIQRAPEDSGDVVDALFRIAMLEAEGGRYAKVVSTLELILARGDVPPAARTEALARMGHALVELRRYDDAEPVLTRALFTAADPDDAEPELESATENWAAMAQYYLADIPRRRFAAIPLRMPESQMQRDVEQKSELFLEAEKRYLAVVKYRVPYWATAAVYQIGDMYKQFWDDFMLVPAPDSLTGDAAHLYVQKLNTNERLRSLLEQAVLYHERNVAMSRGGRVWTRWSEASRRAGLVLRGLVGRQHAGELFRPGELVGHQASARMDPMREDTSTTSGDDYLPSRVEL